MVSFNPPGVIYPTWVLVFHCKWVKICIVKQGADGEPRLYNWWARQNEPGPLKGRHGKSRAEPPRRVRHCEMSRDATDGEAQDQPGRHGRGGMTRPARPPRTGRHGKTEAAMNEEARQDQPGCRGRGGTGRPARPPRTGSIGKTSRATTNKEAQDEPGRHNERCTARRAGPPRRGKHGKTSSASTYGVARQGKIK